MHFFVTRKEAKTWEGFLENFKYKREFRFEHVYDIDFHRHYIWISAKVEDTYHPGTLIQISRKDLVPPFHELGEHVALGLLRSLIRAFEDHEIDENIKYEGVVVFDPHKEDV